ncbi:unnamed protein product [Chrysoparadoxa australica]
MQSPPKEEELGNHSSPAGGYRLINAGGSAGERVRHIRSPFKVKASLKRRTSDEPDSQDYEPDESEAWRSHEMHRHRKERGIWWTTPKRTGAKKWLCTWVIGALTGLIAVSVNYCTHKLMAGKFRLIYDMVAKDEGPSWRVLGTYTGINLAFAAIAHTAVYLEPLAAGSGIPEIKCFLNGINIKRVVRVKTLLCKVVGVVFAVGGGLPAGKEGPMIHSGSVVAAGISQGRGRIFGFDTRFTKNRYFRNDHEKRDFVTCGAAAGVASAFGAPIGGVLFSLEEGASYWSTSITWRAFLCSMMAVSTLYAVQSTGNLWGQQELSKMFSFGEFNSESGTGGYAVWELWLFVALGCMGGLIGASFNHLNEKLTRWRMKKVKAARRRLMEVLAVSVLVSLVSFTLPLLWGKCTPKPVSMEEWTNQERDLVADLVPFNCPQHTHYNEVASLFFTDADTAIRQLFHYRENADRLSPTFSSGALFVFFLPYVLLACITYGIAVPSGLFVPSLLSGAAFGRLAGHLLHRFNYFGGTFADSGTYALIGAAAALGGMARMTISLTVIILEATGDMQYVLPLMLTLMASRWVGNIFNEGLYDIHIKLREFPFLEDELAPFAQMYDMTASQAMSKEVVCFRPIEKVGVVYDTLRSCSHGCFPVIDSSGGDGSQGTSEVLVGTILRKAMTVLIQKQAFGQPTADPRSPGLHSPLIKWRALEDLYPRYPTVESLYVSERQRDCWLDLRPYLNTAPYVINESASMARTYRLFRTLGLRHLCVVNHRNEVKSTTACSPLSLTHSVHGDCPVQCSPRLI